MTVARQLALIQCLCAGIVRDVALTVAPQLPMHQRFRTYNMRSCCVDGRAAACNAAAILRLQYGRMLQLQSHRGLQRIQDFALTMRAHIAMTAVPQLAIYERVCACNVRAYCDGGHTAACDASAVRPCCDDGRTAV